MVACFPLIPLRVAAKRRLANVALPILSEAINVPLPPTVAPGSALELQMVSVHMADNRVTRQGNIFLKLPQAKQLMAIVVIGYTLVRRGLRICSRDKKRARKSYRA
jgi:hypothetical protein